MPVEFDEDSLKEYNRNGPIPRLSTIERSKIAERVTVMYVKDGEDLWLDGSGKYWGGCVPGNSEIRSGDIGTGILCNYISTFISFKEFKCYDCSGNLKKVY